MVIKNNKKDSEKKQVKCSKIFLKKKKIKDEKRLEKDIEIFLKKKKEKDINNFWNVKRGYLVIEEIII